MLLSFAAGQLQPRLYPARAAVTAFAKIPADLALKQLLHDRRPKAAPLQATATFGQSAINGACRQRLPQPGNFRWTCGTCADACMGGAGHTPSDSNAAGGVRDRCRMDATRQRHGAKPESTTAARRDAPSRNRHTRRRAENRPERSAAVLPGIGASNRSILPGGQVGTLPRCASAATSR